MSLACAGLMVVGGDVLALDHSQRVGSPLKLGEVELELTYSNDFSGEDRIDRETSFIMDGKRTRLPDPGAEWIAEGWGGADICAGKLWLAPEAFKSCGEKVERHELDPSHMVVWNKNRFPAAMMFEFTVNHNGSDNGLTLVFFAAEGQQGRGRRKCAVDRQGAALLSRQWHSITGARSQASRRVGWSHSARIGSLREG
jgi:hypothetical protein